jgi:Uma2 family endonuclease
MSAPAIKTRRWSRVEYDRLIEKGVFLPDERLELLAGELVVREPQKTPHAAGIQLVEDALRQAFGPGWAVRVQLPVALDDESEPEPDVAVVPGGPRDYLDAHPSRPVLVVEVAGSSLALDRDYKGSLYARASLADYWILNLVDGVLEVYRQPAPAPSARFGWAYSEVQSLGAAGVVAPLAAPDAGIPVAALLP